MIINTRPKEVSKKIIDLCTQEKVEFENIHLSSIEFISGANKQNLYKQVIDNINNFSNIIFTSQAAAKFGTDLFNSQTGMLNSNQNIFSIGDTTKKILMDRGFESITPINKSSQGIIDLIKEKYPGRNLIFCGENSNMNLQYASAVILIYNFLTFEFIYKNLNSELVQNKFFVLASERIESEVLKIVNDKDILNKIYVSSSYLDKDMLRKARELI